MRLWGRGFSFRKDSLRTLQMHSVFTIALDVPQRDCRLGRFPGRKKDGQKGMAEDKLLVVCRGVG